LKSLEIIDLNVVIKIEDLILNAKFKLAPSKRIFSRIRANLYFDGQLMKTFYLGIPYYLGRQENFPLRSVISLENAKSGPHTIRLEMGGLWPSAEPSEAKEIAIDYVTLEEREMATAIPIVKKIEGPGVAVVTEDAKRLYQEMRERWKKEVIAQRER